MLEKYKNFLDTLTFLLHKDIRKSVQQNLKRFRVRWTSCKFLKTKKSRCFSGLEHQCVFNTKESFCFSGLEHQWVFNTKESFCFSGLENQLIFNISSVIVLKLYLGFQFQTFLACESSIVFGQLSAIFCLKSGL